MEQDAAIAADELIIDLDGKTDLRRARRVDEEEYYAVVKRNITRLGAWLPWASPSYSPEDARQFLTASAAENAAGISLATIIRHRGLICGSICLHRFNQIHKSSSVGYWIDEAHEGKGIVTAASRAIVTEGFRSFGLHRIEIRCATRNHRSSAIPRRLGFGEEGILREAEWLRDKWVDLRVFSMLAQDWKELAGR